MLSLMMCISKYISSCSPFCWIADHTIYSWRFKFLKGVYCPQNRSIADYLISDHISVVGFRSSINCLKYSLWILESVWSRIIASSFSFLMYSLSPILNATLRSIVSFVSVLCNQADSSIDYKYMLSQKLLKFDRLASLNSLL